MNMQIRLYEWLDERRGRFQKLVDNMPDNPNAKSGKYNRIYTKLYRKRWSNGGLLEGTVDDLASAFTKIMGEEIKATDIIFE